MAPDSRDISIVGGSGVGCWMADRAAEGANRLVGAAGNGKLVRDTPRLTIENSPVPFYLSHCYPDNRMSLRLSEYYTHLSEAITRKKRKAGGDEQPGKRKGRLPGGSLLV